MAVFEYSARDASGVMFSGTYNDIPSIAALRDELAKMGETLIKAKKKNPSTHSEQKIRNSHTVTFAYKFSGMCAAGLSIIKSLDTLEKQAESRSLRYVLADIKAAIERGSTLKDAFDKHRHVFGDFFIGMIEAGESSGNLGTTLEMSAKYMENQANIRQKVRSAFAYPIVVSSMCLLVITIMIIFIIPVFKKLYDQLHVSLPGPTQFLVTASQVFRHGWWLIILLLAAGVLLFKYLIKKPSVRDRIDIFKLKMPVFGTLNRMIVVSKFIRTFAMLVTAGVTLTEALKVAGNVVNNTKVSAISDDLQQSIEAGNPVANSLKSHDIFPLTIIQLADSGEEIGQLPVMLNKGVDFLDKDIERKVAALLVILEPLMTLIMGIIIGFILLAVYLPMFDYMAQVK